MNTTGWLDSLALDVRYAWRGMRGSPAFTIVAVATLAVGIGVNAAVFTVTNAVVFKGFPFVVKNDRVLYLQTRSTNHPQERYGFSLPVFGVSYPDFEDWRAQSRAFAGLAAYGRGRPVRLGGQDDFPDGDYESAVSANAFHVLGLRPMLGRDFLPSDEKPDAAPVVILSYALWHGRYGSDPTIVGRTIRIDDTPTTVVGIMPEGSAFLPGFALWVPLVPTPDLQQRSARSLWFAFGRIADGATVDSTRADMDMIGRRLASAYPSDEGFAPVVQRFQEIWSGPHLTLLYESMWGAVGFVLLIACANLANLLLARAMGRSREVSIRIALGAGRWRIIRQLLVESVMLAAMGGGLGWWIAEWGTRAYALAAYPGSFTSWDFTMDDRVLGYLIAISIATGLLFGLAPALRVSRLDVNRVLKDGDRGATGGRATYVSALLVTGEVALALVLLTGAGVMIRSFLHLYTADLGVDAGHVLIAGFRQRGATTTFGDPLMKRLESIPGVESIAMATTLPTGGSLSLAYELAGAPAADARHRPILSAMIVGPAYFETMGATVRGGREFNDFDEAAAAPVVIVNEQLASRFWPGENPLGKRLRLFNGAAPDALRTVVGVVSNIVQQDLRQNTIASWRGGFEPLAYLPYQQEPPRTMVVVARTRVPPGPLVTTFRQQIRALEPASATNVGTLAERLADSYRTTRVNATLFLIFAAIALLLAALGLYAVVAHVVSRRTQEIGVRIAMGATARNILALVLVQGMRPVGVGLVVGLAASFAVTPVLRSTLVQVSPADPASFVAAAGVLMAVAVLGCLIPARRATRVDPVVALRHE